MVFILYILTCISGIISFFWTFPSIIVFAVFCSMFFFVISNICYNHAEKKNFVYMKYSFFKHLYNLNPKLFTYDASLYEMSKRLKFTENYRTIYIRFHLVSYFLFRMYLIKTFISEKINEQRNTTRAQAKNMEIICKCGQTEVEKARKQAEEYNDKARKILETIPKQTEDLGKFIYTVEQNHNNPFDLDLYNIKQKTN